MKIRVVLGEKRRNMEYLNAFIDNGEDYLDATERVLLHSLSNEVYLCHSKAMCSTAGCMIGSYNYTNAARLCNQEHASLFGPGTGIVVVLWNLYEIELELYKTASMCIVLSKGKHTGAARGRCPNNPSMLLGFSVCPSCVSHKEPACSVKHDQRRDHAKSYTDYQTTHHTTSYYHSVLNDDITS